MRQELPRGTVTFVFTDVEGSTRLLHDLGDLAYADALAEHRRQVREAFAEHGGVEVDTQGDAFFYAFSSAPDAVAAAVEAQQRLAAGPIRVRMGLHTGTPATTDEGYVGYDVHRAARIAAVAHGGQIVVSASTSALVDRSDLVDLGPHRLKDLSAPERIHQVGSTRFPPLRSLYRTNLPVPTTPFLGRERDVSSVVELLRRPDVRMVTLTGVGGTGKTRVALQAAAAAADDYPDGVFWVPLAPLTASGLVPTAAASALGAIDDVVPSVGTKRMLLVLDNFEHVLDAADAVATWLASCPNLDVLVTSREPLRLAGEQRFAVPPMSGTDGERLFLERARAVDPSVAMDATISEICTRLDNLPLAIELAAARLNVLTPTQLLSRLTERLSLLTTSARDTPERHRTLRATIAWSYGLLTPGEQALFRRFGLFVGGASLDAVEVVTGADLEELSSLVDKSLIRRIGERFSMLETIREFALERLDAEGESKAARAAYVDYFAGLASSAHLAVEDFDKGIRHDLVRGDVPNLRAAMDWAVADGRPVVALSIGTSLEQMWAVTDPVEGVSRMTQLLDAAPGAPAALRARAHRVLGGMSFLSGRFDDGMRHSRTAREMFRELGDDRNVAHMAIRLAGEAARLRDTKEVRRLLDETEDLPRWRTDDCQRMGFRAVVAEIEGRPEDALADLRRSAELAASVGFSWWQASMLVNLAESALRLERPDTARDAALAALPLFVELDGRREVAYALSVLAGAEAGAGRDEAAGRWWGAVEAESRRRPLGSWEMERDQYAAWAVRESAEFEAGRRAGATLGLFEAAALAMSDK